MKSKWLLLLLVLILNSCTIYNRQHFSGFTFQSRGITKSKTQQGASKSDAMESSASPHVDMNDNNFSELASNDSSGNMQFKNGDKSSPNSDVLLGSQKEKKEEVCDKIQLKN